MELRDFNEITIFRHTGADADALGAQFGLKTFLMENFPDKNVYAIGDDVGGVAHLFPARDKVSDDTIAQSCAIILDTANRERIDDKRYEMAKKIIKIDHHIVVDEYADVAFVDTSAAATSQILTKMFMNSEYTLSRTTARFLYLGILADTLSFTTSSVSIDTFTCASYLLSCGIDVSAIQQERVGMSFSDFEYMNLIRNNTKQVGKVIYAIMKVEDYEKFGFTYNVAKEKVFALSNIKEYPIYCLFSEDATYGQGFYNGSLRARGYTINEIANQYGGGGHANACGVKQLALDDIERLVLDLNNL